MTQTHKLIASFVHGNALGVVLEPLEWPVTCVNLVPDELWEIRIGPLVQDAAGPEFPKEDYEKVVADLKQFCDRNDLAEWIRPRMPEEGKK